MYRKMPLKKNKVVPYKRNAFKGMTISISTHLAANQKKIANSNCHGAKSSCSRQQLSQEQTHSCHGIYGLFLTSDINGGD
jgi:hypothetical protein